MRQPDGLPFEWQGNPTPEVYTPHLEAPSLSGDNRDASKRKRTSSSGGEWGNKRRSITTGVQANWVNREEAKAQAHCNHTSTKLDSGICPSYYWLYHSVDPLAERPSRGGDCMDIDGDPVDIHSVDIREHTQPHGSAHCP